MQKDFFKISASMIQNLKINRPSVWKHDFSIESTNGTLATVKYLNSMMSEAKIQTQTKHFFLEKHAMGAEISLFDGETNEEIALAESKISMTATRYELRFRFKEDKYTFHRKSLWKNSEFEWRNEAEQELMRITQKWNWFKQETFVDVNTQLTQGDDVVFLSVLGMIIIHYYQAAQGT